MRCWRRVRSPRCWSAAARRRRSRRAAPATPAPPRLGCSNTGTITGIAINNSTITGTIANSGTISPNGIALTNGSTITATVDGIADSGTIGGGISIDRTSAVASYSRTAISISDSVFSGGIGNAGTIMSTFGNAIVVDNTATFEGGISNSGTISAAPVLGFGNSAGNGIWVGGSASRTTLTISTFTGGISNSGTISAGSNGIWVGGIASLPGGTHSTATLTVATFSGGISNSGTISAGGAGIWAGGTASVLQSQANVVSVTISTFSGGISNSGTILAGGNGIWVGGIASSPRIATVRTSNATLTIATFSGGISNSGMISAGGAGILVGGDASMGEGDFGNVTFALSTFSGGIGNSGTITAGGAGIWVGGDAAMLSTPGITNVATVTISTFGGGISNSGTISAGGNGIWVGGNASLSGGTGSRNTASVTISTFSGGISNSGTILAAGAGIMVGGAANANVNGSGNTASVTIVTFSGGISNSGTISAGGAGIEVGGSANAGRAGNTVAVTISTFSGGISNSGKIVAQTGIAVNHVLTFLGAIVNSGTITGSGGTAIDVSGAPNGMIVDILGGAISGNIVGNGTGNGDTVNFALGSGSFAYANTITGIQTVNINSGTLFDSGTITAGGVTVNSSGTLAPGLPNTTGTLSIAGNLAFSGGDYEIQLTPSAHASATVSGNLTINNGTVALSPSGPLGAHYSATTFSILTYGGTLAGTFNPTVTYTGTVQLSSAPTVSYVPNNVDLSYGNSLVDLATPAGANQNQQNVINGINNAILAGDTVPAGFQQLGSLSVPAYLNAITRLDGEDATGAQTGAFTLMNEFLELMLGDNGGVGGSNGGLGFAPDQHTELPPDIALAYDSILKAPPKQTFDNRWSVWGSGFGGSSITSGNAAVGSNNVTTTTYGSAAGMEYRPDPNTRLGFALAGSGLNWGLAQGLGTGRADAFQAGVYGKTYFGPAYLSGALAFGNNWFTTNRTALGDQLTASFTGQSYALRGETGYRYTVPFEKALIGVTPYAALQTQWFHTPAYSETDLTGGGFGLSYNANTANDTRSELGARFDDLTTFNNKPLILRSSLAWAHDWVSGTGLNAAFQALPGSAFTVNGAAVPPDSALTTASAQYFFTPDLSFTAKFDGEFAPTAQTYAGSGTLKYTF